jgi:mannosyltransferase
MKARTPAQANSEARDLSGTFGFAARTNVQNLLLLALMLAAFALRIYHLDAQSFWSDEGISVIRARNDFGALLAALPLEHMPLYFAGLHVWMQLTGEGDFAVRFFSLFFSVLAVPLVYDLGAIVERQRTLRQSAPNQGAFPAFGFFAASLAVINPLQIWYAQEARMYSLVVALCAGAAWCLARAYVLHCESKADADSPTRAEKRYWLGFALLGAGALYTHFFASLTLVALGLWTAVAARKMRSLWRPLLASTALVGLLFVPWLPRAVAALGFPGWQPAADPLSLPGRYLVAYTLGTTLAEPWTWLALGFLVLLAIGTWLLARRGMLGGLALFGVFVPFVIMMLIALKKPGYQERYLIVVTPFLFVIFGAALDRLRGMTGWPNRFKVAPFAAGAALVGVTAFFSINNLYFEPSFAKPDYRAAAQYVDSLSRAGDGLIFDGPDPYKAFYRYFSRQRVTAFDATNFDSEDPSDADQFLNQQVPQRDRWWVVLYFHPAGPTEDWLARYGYQTSSHWFNGIRVLLYATPTEAALQTLRPTSVQTSLPLQIASVRTLPTVHAGDILPVIIRWQPAGPLPEDYQASVRLLDANGNRVRQLDRRPLDGRVPTSQWKPGEVVEDRYGLLVPEVAAEGQYSIEVILYRLDGGDVLKSPVSKVQVVNEAIR